MEETSEMSSPLEESKVEETVLSLNETASKESASSFKTSDENETVRDNSDSNIDCDSNVSSVSLIVQPSSSYNDSNQDMILAQVSDIELAQGSSTSTELEAATEIQSEGDALAPVYAVDEIQVASSLVSAEARPDASTNKAALDQLDSELSVRSVSRDYVGSGESLIEPSESIISHVVRQNAIPVQSIGDTSIQGNLLEEKQLPDCGKVSGKSSEPQTLPSVDVPPCEMIKCEGKIENSTLEDNVIVKPGISTEHEPVVTIMKPKAQNVHHKEQMVRVQSENFGLPPKKKSFLLADIVSGRLDLGENAEVLDDLIYWRNPKKTGFIFVVGLSMLMSMQYYSLISVMAYLSLVLLACGLVNRLCTTSQGSSNPLVEFSASLSEESVKKFTDVVAYYVNDTMLAMRRLYLVEDVGDSIKFGVVLWYLTYVGLWFNGMTIVTICFVTIFTLPNIYMRNQQKLDEKMSTFWQTWLDLSTKARAVSQNSLARILSVEERRVKVNLDNQKTD